MGEQRRTLRDEFERHGDLNLDQGREVVKLERRRGQVKSALEVLALTLGVLGFVGGTAKVVDAVQDRIRSIETATNDELERQQKELEQLAQSILVSFNQENNTRK